MNVYESLFESVRRVAKNLWLGPLFLLSDFFSGIVLIVLIMLIFGQRINALTSAGIGVGEAVRSALVENVLGSVIVFGGVIIALGFFESVKRALSIRVAQKKRLDIRKALYRAKETWARITGIIIFNSILMIGAAVFSVVSNFNFLIVIFSIIFSFLVALFTQYNMYLVFVTNKSIIGAIIGGVRLVVRRPLESIVIALVLSIVSGTLGLVFAKNLIAQFVLGSLVFAPITTVYVFLNVLEMKKDSA
ncbi:hypothetical protein COT72_00785 [archaeon CG10_big_fil_rev_8_21_14_0_10_43_11]|nr:MAG: hypothetical protein COT72_00785 [archaeon CG10_big_fil_rev_8_21_14_0_10_43_11]